eukprot:2618545-Pleurochrysis_carterae.AAC.1
MGKNEGLLTLLTKETSGRGFALVPEGRHITSTSRHEQRRGRVSGRKEEIKIGAPTNIKACTAREMTPATKDGATNIAEAAKDSNDADASMVIDA